MKALSYCMIFVSACRALGFDGFNVMTFPLKNSTHTQLHNICSNVRKYLAADCDTTSQNQISRMLHMLSLRPMHFNSNENWEEAWFHTKLPFVNAAMAKRHVDLLRERFGEEVLRSLQKRWSKATFGAECWMELPRGVQNSWISWLQNTQQSSSEAICKWVLPQRTWIASSAFSTTGHILPLRPTVFKPRPGHFSSKLGFEWEALFHHNSKLLALEW